LLSLQWSQVSLARTTIQLKAAKTKTAKARAVPVTQRLKAVLEMRRHAPDGAEHGPEAYVFGNEVGERVSEWTVRQQWDATCAAAKITGLQFHDLRHECGSRLLEAGVPLHKVRDWLGHSNVTTTSRYLQTTTAGMTGALRRLEEHQLLLCTPRAHAPAHPQAEAPSEAPSAATNLLN
jgi:integrase